MDFGFWDETLVLWEEQGYPKGVSPDDFFGMDQQWIGAPIQVDLYPAFPHTVIEDKGETEIVRDESGVTVERGKLLGSIPRHVDHTLKDRKSWESEFLPRLDGYTPERYPANWDDLVVQYKHRDRDYPLGVPAGSLFGRLRDWMGLEGISLIAYDDPALFREMVRSVANCVIATLRRALDSGIQFDYATMWEGMCYRSGPLLSPGVFDEVLVPQYKRITNMLRDHGVDIVVLDCDGDITKLAPLWLKGGVNTMFPLEVGVWCADPIALRAKFGKEMRLIGGVDKRLLAGSMEDITNEVERLAPLVEEGGYIPTPDHRVPPNIPLANYFHYLHEARRVWGKDLPSLQPMASNWKVVDE